MKVQIEVDGKTETVDVSVDSLTLRQSVEVQLAVGNEEWDSFIRTQVARPVVILAIVMAKLRRLYPDLDLDDADAEFLTEDIEELDPTETG
jgi:hypothetical protein